MIRFLEHCFCPDSWHSVVWAKAPTLLPPWAQYRKLQLMPALWECKVNGLVWGGEHFDYKKHQLATFDPKAYEIKWWVSIITSILPWYLLQVVYLDFSLWNLSAPHELEPKNGVSMVNKISVKERIERWVLFLSSPKPHSPSPSSDASAPVSPVWVHDAPIFPGTTCFAPPYAITDPALSLCFHCPYT